MPHSDPDPRQKAILGAAFDAFRLYGFRKTSMQDIADRAGMSRAALYLHFDNKEAIFRALTAWYFDVSETGLRAALTPGLDPVSALTAAFDAQVGPEFEALLDSPHGVEFFDTKSATSADIAQQGEARLSGIIADWLAAGAESGHVDLPPGSDARDTADMIQQALHSIKSQAGTPADHRIARHRLAALLGRGLRAQDSAP